MLYLNHHKTNPTERSALAMNSITQKMRYRLSLIKYAQKYGVTKAAVKYNTNRQYIYRWMKRYDGTMDSLRDQSRRPHSRMKSDSLRTCAAVILTRVWLYSGSNCEGEATNAPSLDYTGFCGNRESWQSIRLIPNISQNLTKKCLVQVNGSRSM